MNNSSVNDQLQISGDPSSGVQQALLGVANSRNGMMTSDMPTTYNLTSLSGANAKRRYTHSKILTAQGLRDRRVRLSVGIARRLFDLQEMLGYDKASKTLEWLLGKASGSIETLAQGKTTGLIVSSHGIGIDGVCSPLGSKCKGLIVPRKGKGKNAAPVSGMKCAKNSNVIARDQSRAKARARARERTIARALMAAQLDVFAGDLLASQTPHTNIVLPSSTTGKHLQISLLDDELKVPMQNAATCGKVTSLDFLHCHKELSTCSDVNNFNSFVVSLPKEWDA